LQVRALDQQQLPSSSAQKFSGTNIARRKVTVRAEKKIAQRARFCRAGKIIFMAQCRAAFATPILVTSSASGNGVAMWDDFFAGACFHYVVIANDAISNVHLAKLRE